MYFLSEFNMLILDHLIFEVTRKCTQQCKHCMCGPMQNINIDKKIIDAFFSQIEYFDHVYIGELFFTGGEPLLNTESINYILDKISSSVPTIEVNHFGMKTNGMVYNEKVKNTLYRLYEISEKKENCWLTCSLDQFHIQPNESNLKSFGQMPFFEGTENYKLKKADIMNTGLAKKNNLGCPKQGDDFENAKKTIKYIIQQEEQDEVALKITQFLDDICINSKGYILTNIDGSYEFQDKYNKGNILIDNIFSNARQVNLKRAKVKIK